jgi:hypothetical protein
MKTPSRNQALLAELKKAREKIPPAAAPEAAPPESTVAPANVPAADTATAPDPTVADTAAPLAAPTGIPTGSIGDVAVAPAATTTAESASTLALPPSSAAPTPTIESDGNTAWPSALTAHTGEGRWTRSGLLHTLAASLPPDFPAIHYGGEEICARGVYRAVDRHCGGTVVRISGPGGTRELSPRKNSAAYGQWLAHFSRHPVPDPRRDATRLCCAELVKHLENFEDYQRGSWIKVIDPAAWEPAGEKG